MYLVLLAIIALALELLFGKMYLKWISTKNFEQPLLDIGPDHAEKQGTPTMGGISFIGAILASTIIAYIGLAIAGIDNSMLPILIVVLIAYAYIGYRDDILKVTKRDNGEGLSPKQKLMAQFAVAVVAVIYLILIHFNMELDINLLNVKLDVSSPIMLGLYSILVIFLFMGVSNATNLTDGLDGLLTSTYIVSFLSLLVIAINQGNQGIAAFIVIVIFSLAGFLKYNSNPAKMFMGDTGSLALGGLLVIISVFMHIELMIFYFGFVFLLETISVMLQVTYFKYTKKKYGEGRRLFKMAPFHHHLEKEGYNEKKIVLILSAMQLVASIIGLIVYFT